MGFLGFGNKKKGFDLPASDAVNIVNIITEADKHAYELSLAELKFEMQELALFNDVKESSLKGVDFLKRQIKNNTLSDARLDHIYELFKGSLSGINRLEQSTINYKRYAENIIEFVSKSEETIRKYLRDKGHDEAVELRWVHEKETEVIKKISNFADLLKDIRVSISALISLLNSSDIKSVDANVTISKIKDLSYSIEHKLSDVEVIVKNMHRINKKVASKLHRITNLDHLLGQELNKFMEEAKAKHPLYKGGSV